MCSHNIPVIILCLIHKSSFRQHTGRFLHSGPMYTGRPRYLRQLDRAELSREVRRGPVRLAVSSRILQRATIRCHRYDIRLRNPRHEILDHNPHAAVSGARDRIACSQLRQQRKRSPRDADRNETHVYREEAQLETCGTGVAIR